MATPSASNHASARSPGSPQVRWVAYPSVAGRRGTVDEDVAPRVRACGCPKHGTRPHGLFVRRRITQHRHEAQISPPCDVAAQPLHHPGDADIGMNDPRPGPQHELAGIAPEPSRHGDHRTAHRMRLHPQAPSRPRPTARLRRYPASPSRAHNGKEAVQNILAHRWGELMRWCAARCIGQREERRTLGRGPVSDRPAPPRATVGCWSAMPTVAPGQALAAPRGIGDKRSGEPGTSRCASPRMVTSSGSPSSSVYDSSSCDRAMRI
jgi:hypothetical protein